MKLNLIRNSTEFLNSYTNVSLFCDPNLPDLILADYSDLDFVADSEAKEIRALNILPFMDRNKVQETLSHWVSKLRHGGILKIGGPDLYEICRNVELFQLSFNNANVLLYGTLDTPWNIKKSCYSMHEMSAELANRGLKIVTKYITDYNYIIEGVRS